MIDNETVHRIAAGAAGSGLAAWMARVVGLDLVIMFIGGTAAAWFFGSPTAEYFNLTKHESAVGFAVGFLAILIMRKLYETVQSIEVKELGAVFIDKLRSFLGVPK